MNKKENKKSIHIILFPGVELLDFAGPYEIFSVAGNGEYCEVTTVAMRGLEVESANGMRVIADQCVDVDESSDLPDVLFIPGGRGVQQLLTDDVFLDWLRERCSQVETIVSVCTGSLLLAKIGLLTNKSATTHASAYDQLASISPSTNVMRGVRVVEQGNIYVSAGVAAGMDLSFYLLKKWGGHELAKETANEVEYPYWDEMEVYVVD